MKKRNVLAVTATMLFMAVAFAGGVSGGSGERAHYSDAEYNGAQVAAVMRPDYKVPPSNEGE